jgi:hypothetical protein
VPQLPLTSSESYLPSLGQLDHHLATFLQVVHQFSSEYAAKFLPLVEPLANGRVELNPLGKQLALLSSEKQQLDQLLDNCVNMKRHYASMMRQEIRAEMEKLMQVRHVHT